MFALRALTQTKLEDNLLLSVKASQVPFELHWYAMWFNYNAKLKCKELLLQEDWTVKQIRRAETLEDYLKTIDYPWLFELV